MRGGEMEGCGWLLDGMDDAWLMIETILRWKGSK